MILKKKIKEVTTKYTWKFWGLVIGEITFIVIFILLFGLSIKPDKGELFVSDLTMRH